MLEPRKFKCFGCKNTFKTDQPACIYYDEDEVNNEGYVSLCEDCVNYLETKKEEIELLKSN